MSTINVKTAVCGLLLVSAVIASAAPSSKLPKGLIRCKKTDPKLDECLKDEIQNAVTYMVKGIPELGINKIDPLRIVKLNVNENTGPIMINSTFSDADILNLRFAVINKIHYDLETYNLSLEVLLPKPVSMVGDYEINGKVIVLPIMGKGKFKFDADISKADIYIKFTPTVKNGNTYLKITDSNWYIIPTRFQIQFDNLFDGDKALGDSMNRYLNDNWKNLLIQSQPFSQRIFNSIFTSLVQQFLDRVPESDLFLV